eukprot:4130997-Ditylum_brightwellii.AAC.1
MSEQNYIEEGVEEDVMKKVKVMKSGLDSISLDGKVGPLQQVLTKSKGAIYVSWMTGQATLTSGAIALAAVTDEHMGSCMYEDVAMFVEEQTKAQGEMPGPLPVVSHDLVVDELQLNQAAVVGVHTLTITLGVVSAEKVPFYLKAVKTLNLKVIVNVDTAEQAQEAVDAGAMLFCVAGADGAENKKAVIVDLNLLEGNKKVCAIANIVAKNNQQLEEVEESWIFCDGGFNAVLVSDALYKGWNNPVHHPGAIITQGKRRRWTQHSLL